MSIRLRPIRLTETAQTLTDKIATVPISFRGGFYGAVIVAVLVGLFLIWLWRPERQLRRHTENFLKTIEHKNWTAAADFIGSDYQDQWGEDRARVLERMRNGFRYVRGARINASNPTVRIENRRAIWSGKIMIDGDQSEVMELLKERVNSLAIPFELEWRRVSSKPWDWKLVRVSNSALEIPADFD
jgi:hypothetical protein